MLKYLMVFAVAFAALANGRLAEATPITTGDQFIVRFLETGPCLTAFADSNPAGTLLTCPDPDLGAVTVAKITLGGPAGAGFFSLAGITAVLGGPPSLLTLDFSGVLFEATTLGLSGHLLETFLGGGGGLHADDLALTDIGKTWVLKDDHLEAPTPFTLVTNGTYDVTTPVPEPSTVALFASGLLVLAARRRGHSTAPRPRNSATVAPSSERVSWNRSA